MDLTYVPTLRRVWNGAPVFLKKQFSPCLANSLRKKRHLTSFSAAGIACDAVTLWWFFSMRSSIQTCFQMSVSSVLWFIYLSFCIHPLFFKHLITLSWVKTVQTERFVAQPYWLSSLLLLSFFCRYLQVTCLNDLLWYIPKNSDWFWICLALFLTGTVSSSWTGRVQECFFFFN